MKIRYTPHGSPQAILDEDEIKGLANIYANLRRKKKSFDEYLEAYKRREIEKLLNSKKEVITASKNPTK